ncbi:MAG: hypothetical protein COB67_00495 [SAR324 cluster bacterium]|uniref:Uncharacterized protein n=1 Tax=SAR324 cluster bacterium TaxID=2024889 RepID=A0A2A4TDD5_9DELT|nr:MAG: hypothetical protein COB67_00495 [SAR324 cluster bacterium]
MATGAKKPINIKKTDYFICPKCGDADWPMNYKKYGKFVYCKNKKCSHKFRPENKKKEEFSLHLFTTDKAEAVRILEESITKLKIHQ